MDDVSLPPCGRVRAAARTHGRWVLTAVAALALLAPGPPVAAARTATGTATSPPEAFSDYTDPPWRCRLHRFGDGEPPPLALIGTEPLCVEYSKRDITVTNGGAVDFLLAEPARFAIALPACRYWQRDHWSVQVATGTTRVIGWDGSYWFDKSAGRAAMRLRNITVGGAPADPEEAAALLRPVSPDLADAFLRYAGPGRSLRLPSGLPCPETWR